MTTDSTSFQDPQRARLILATDEKIRTKKDSPNLDADVKHPLQPPIYIYFLFFLVVRLGWQLVELSVRFV